MPKPTCSFDECNRPCIGKKDYCAAHERQYKDGKPLKPIQVKNLPRDVRLAKHSTKDGPAVPGHPEMGKCWQWQGCKSRSTNGTPYGALGYQGKTVKAHRFAWETYNGPIPDGAEIDHMCHNTLCINPTHLRLATRKQNVEHLRGAKSNNKSSGVRNVYPNRNRWQVVVGRKYIGNFATIEEAAGVAARVRAEMFDFPDF